MGKQQNGCYEDLERCGLVEIFHHIPSGVFHRHWLPDGRNNLLKEITR